MDSRASAAIPTPTFEGEVERAQSDILAFKLRWPGEFPSGRLERFATAEMECQIIIRRWAERGERERDLATRMLRQCGLRCPDYVVWAFDPETSLLHESTPPTFLRMVYLSWKTARLQLILEAERGTWPTPKQRTARGHRMLAASIASHIANDQNPDLERAKRILRQLLPKSEYDDSVLSNLYLNEGELFAEFGAFEPGYSDQLPSIRSILGRQRRLELSEELRHQLNGAPLVRVDHDPTVTPPDFESISILHAALQVAKTDAERDAILAMAHGGDKWTDATATLGLPDRALEALQKRLARNLRDFGNQTKE